MAVQEIPTRSDLDNYRFTVDLEGQTFGFNFRFNTRMERWTFDLTLEDGTPILQSLPALSGEFITARYTDSRLPPGQFYFLDTSGQDLDPGRDDLGTRVVLMYLDSTEVA